MKRIIHILFFILFLTNTSYSQSGWIQQQSGVSSTLYKSFFVNSQTGWVVGDNGKILKTTNGGANWMEQNSNTNLPLHSVYFINENSGWVVGGYFDTNFGNSREIILKTLNGGINWTINYFLPISYGFLTDVYFYDNASGFVTCSGGTGSGTYGKLMKTTNNGTQWLYDEVYESYERFEFKNNTAWVFANYNVDVPVAESAYVYKSLDLTQHWTKVFNKPKATIYSGYFLNASTGWLCGWERTIINYDMIYKTTDGGQSWNRQLFQSFTSINDLFFIDKDTGWYCGAGIYKSGNGGIDWEIQLLGVVV